MAENEQDRQVGSDLGCDQHKLVESCHRAELSVRRRNTEFRESMETNNDGCVHPHHGMGVYRTGNTPVRGDKRG